MVRVADLFTSAFEGLNPSEAHRTACTALLSSAMPALDIHPCSAVYPARRLPNGLSAAPHGSLVCCVHIGRSHSIVSKLGSHCRT